MNAGRRRSAAAAKYRPADVDLLVVAQAPPSELSRDFYFKHVPSNDRLFQYVCKVIFGQKPARAEKCAFLTRAGLPVINERIPFPSSGRQIEFERALARAVAQ